MNSIFAVSKLLYPQSFFLFRIYLSGIFNQTFCCHTIFSDIFHQFVCLCYLYLLLISIFLVSYSEKNYTVIYNCRGKFKIWPCQPKSSLSSTLSTAFNISPIRVLCSQWLKIIVREHALIFHPVKNSESNIFQEFLDTQVIKYVCLTQLVYPWLHIKFLLMCVSKMTGF